MFTAYIDPEVKRQLDAHYDYCARFARHALDAWERDRPADDDPSLADWQYWRGYLETRLDQAEAAQRAAQ